MPQTMRHWCMYALLWKQPFFVAQRSSVCMCVWLYNILLPKRKKEDRKRWQTSWGVPTTHSCRRLDPLQRYCYSFKYEYKFLLEWKAWKCIRKHNIKIDINDSMMMMCTVAEHSNILFFYRVPLQTNHFHHCIFIAAKLLGTIWQ